MAKSFQLATPARPDAQERRVLVTGAAGRVGSSFTELNEALSKLHLREQMRPHNESKQS